MIPAGLCVLTSVDGESVGTDTVSWGSQMSIEPPLLAIGAKDGTALLAGGVRVTEIGLRHESPGVLTLRELGLNYGG